MPDAPTGRLDAAFFDRPTLDVARDLLGCRLVRRIGGGVLAGRIVETEAYVGTDDRACHAHVGRKGRAADLFVGPGRYYVYLCYGMHHLLNVVTEREGFPAAVLIRALEPLEGVHLMRRRRPGIRDRDLARGPGRLTAAMEIDAGRHHGRSVASRSLYLERSPDDDVVEDDAVVACPRIGVDYAGEAAAWPYRFYERRSPFVSVRDREVEALANTNPVRGSA